MSGVMRLYAVLVVLLVAALGLLWALGVISREQVESLGLKGLLIVGILGVASLVVGLLINRGKTDKS